MLEKSFDIEEVHSIIMEMDGEKAFGLDGFTIAFFKNSWEVVKLDLMKVFDEFFVRGTINKSMNYTFITLIPKKDGPLSPSDFRPLSLITSVYKIIAKVLSKRIREVTGDIISSS